MPSAHHDAFFKHFLSKPDNARKFLQLYLPPEKLALCDLSTLELQKDSFIDEELKSCFCDLLWSVRTRNHRIGYIYWILEHQSSDDPLIGFRMLRYCLAVIQRHYEAHKKSKNYRLPLVIPLLFYTGKRKPKPQHTDWCSAFAMPQLAKEIYSNPFLMINVSDIPDGQIATHEGLSVMEHLFKTIATGRDLRQAGKQAGELLAESWRSGYTHDEDIKAAISYIMQALKNAEHHVVIEQIQRRFPQKREAIMNIEMTYAEELEHRGMERGMEKGIQKGRLEGRLEGMQKGRLEVARNLLNAGIEFSTVQQVSGLSEAELNALRP